MEEDKTLKNILDDDFGKIILKIRKDRNLTQKELADLINVSDRTISKWENGQSVPDLICIKNICKSLGISPSSLVLDKKTRKEKLYDIHSKVRRFINPKRIINFIILCLLIGLFIFYLNNKDSVTIYKLKLSSDNIIIKNGYIIKTKYKNIIIINDLQLTRNNDYDSINISLYTIVNGDKKIIYTKNKIENIFIDNLNEKDSDKLQDIIKSLTKDLFINIIIEKDGKLETFDGTFSIIERYHNGVIDKNSNYIPIDNKSTNNKINYELINKGYSYNKDKNIYNKTNRNEVISISVDGKFIAIENNNNIKCTYNYDSHSIDYIEYDKYKNKKLYLRVILNNNQRVCKLGKCQNNYKEIDEIKNIYKELIDIL